MTELTINIIFITIIGLALIPIVRIEIWEYEKKRILKAYYASPMGTPFPLLPNDWDVIFSMKRIDAKELLYASDYKNLKPYLYKELSDA